ncbi:hypothetical protein BpHYR1_042333 [Brachionus plicatilis]|uniref:Uncharacterized protein n=1 Tax=Brachionus plicatilis TaxID=10195 RepID=A0A3M7SV49_BRAPC|nr:hypothetical protein BpHYR1_042333 [Brachionus plicatilis]
MHIPDSHIKLRTLEQKISDECLEFDKKVLIEFINELFTFQNRGSIDSIGAEIEVGYLNHLKHNALITGIVESELE